MTEYINAKTIFLGNLLFGLTASYCPPLVAIPQKETNISCRPPNEFQFSSCSSSWLPDGTIAHYECLNNTSDGGEKIEGFILCNNSEEDRFKKIKMSNATALPCGLKRDFSVPEIHVFGYSPVSHYTTPSPGSYNNDTVTLHESGYELMGLKLHNDFRKAHGSPPLKLKIELSTMAQKWADHLVAENTFDMAKTNYYGQNLFNSESMDKTQAVSDAIQNWYYEGMKMYNFDEIESNWANSLALNFAQLVWKSSEFLGIGVSNWNREDKNGSMVVAYYYPTGNIVLDSEEHPDKKFKENVAKRL